MATIANLEVEQVRQHLIAGGFLAAFSDIFGNAQPAPQTQINELRLDNLSKYDRAIMIRNTGGTNNPTTSTFFNQRNMMIVVVGNIGETDSIIANGLAIDINEYLLNTPYDGECLANISTSGVSGPFTLPEGRRAYEINFNAMFNV
tara:strand:+ start:13940 stop:14377 length:438 start_codon:yes stop_codon:yes gene_type:complete